jgi:hypothetical protein
VRQQNSNPLERASRGVAISTDRISWTRVTLEGVVIVGSILLAFGIEAGGEARGERQQRQAIVAALQRDFATARGDLDRVRGSNQRIEATAEAVSVALEANSTTVAVPLVDVVQLIRTPTYDPPLGELRSLVQSGQVSLIRDADLRNALATWETFVADLNDESELQVAFIYEEFIPFLREIPDFPRIVDARFGVPPDSDAALPTSAEFKALVQHLRLLARRTLRSGRSIEKLYSSLDRIDAGLVRETR